MRFDRLDILRYGALTDRSLSFRPDTRLHIIYGPNEAGKSSALKAISDLLFGFPERSDYTFLHDAGALRVGARIIGGGSTLDFRRRKGRKNTLLAATDAEEPLADDALSPFLGTLSRDVFERAFGLDSGSLRSGGETMLKSGGEIGGLLFAAASGLTGLSKLKKEIDTEADGIYAPRRSKDRLFYQILDAHDEARREERDSELKSGDWKKLLAEQAQTEAELEAIRTGRHETKRRLDDLQRLVRIEPVIRELDRLRHAMLPYRSIAHLHRAFEERLSAAIAAYDDARRNHQAVTADILRFNEEAAAVRVDETALSEGNRILAAFSQKGAYLNAREDLARVRQEVDTFDQRLVLAARRLGFAAFDALSAAQPADADLARLRTLLDEGVVLDRDLRQIRQQYETARDTLHRIDAGEAGIRLIDPKPFMDQLAALRPELSDLQGIDAARVKLARAQKDLADALARLDPPVADIGNLLAAPLPDLATLTAHRGVIDAARGERDTATRKLSELKEEAAAIAGQLAALEGGAGLVSREDIAAARASRDDRISALSVMPADTERDALVAAVTEADRLSDMVLADAERVSRHAQLGLRRRELDHAIETALRAVREAEIAASDAITDFEDLFRGAPVKPGGPARMIEWRRAAQDVMTLAALNDDARDALDILTSKEERLRPTLASLAETLGLAVAHLPLLPSVRALDAALGELSTRWTESRSNEGKRHAARETVETLEAREATLMSATERWRRAFAHAAAMAGLAEDATTEMAAAALDVWKTVPDLIQERENRARRVRGMMRDMENFEDEIAGLCRTVAADIAGLPADVAADMLNRRATEAQAAHGRRDTLSSALQRARLSADRLAGEANASSAALSNLFVEAMGLEDQAGALDAPADEAAIIVRARSLLSDLAEKLRLDGEIARSLARLADEAVTPDEAALRERLVDFDRVEAGLEIERLESEDGRQFDRMKVLGSAQAEIDRRRRDMETGIGAERAAFQKSGAEQEARELARRWVVLKLAAGLLANSLETYREKQADPVMQRAGAIFSELTDRRFTRLLQVYDENDDLHLAAERASGERVELNGLSEGTGDQLYLALRLAFLEDYSTRNEPAPLVLDDIFQTFDDERTAAGLRALAQFGGMRDGDRDGASPFQTLLFTHQKSLVEIAERELGASADIITLDRV
ncbi:MAG: AAA family ATPase [Neorhizobium sp.]|nr:AAA family ATPase [Neorhizobium sp.]